MQSLTVKIIKEDSDTVTELKDNFVQILDYVFSSEELIEKYEWLASIDSYGLTFFNIRQTSKISRELEELKRESKDEEITRLIDKLLHFVEGLEQHTFLKFAGD